VPLKIDLTPELERRLAVEAARHGQIPADFARAVLEERLTGTAPASDALAERTPEQILSDFFRRYPRRSPGDLLKIAAMQGVQPFARVEDFAAGEPVSDDEFDVDAFLAARKEWQWEGRLQDDELAEPEDARQ
jgi:plasmid stability protein